MGLGKSTDSSGKHIWARTESCKLEIDGGILHGRGWKETTLVSGVRGRGPGVSSAPTESAVSHRVIGTCHELSCLGTGCLDTPFPMALMVS